MARGTRSPLRGWTGDGERSFRQRAGLLLVGVAALFLVVLELATAMVPGYSVRTAAISDLGVHPETALLFNATLVIVGGLDLLAGYYFHQIHGKRWLFAIYILAGIGAAGVGLFPLGSGPLHGVFAVVAFFFFNLEAIGSGLQVLGAVRSLSLLAGCLGLGFLVAFVLGGSGMTGLFGPFGYGGTERMIVYPAMAWALVFGGYMLGIARE